MNFTLLQHEVRYLMLVRLVALMLGVLWRSWWLMIWFGNGGRGGCRWFITHQQVITFNTLFTAFISTKVELRKCVAISLTTLGHPLHWPTASQIIFLSQAADENSLRSDTGRLITWEKKIIRHYKMGNPSNSTNFANKPQCPYAKPSFEKLFEINTTSVWAKGVFVVSQIDWKVREPAGQAWAGLLFGSVYFGHAK